MALEGRLLWVELKGPKKAPFLRDLLGDYAALQGRGGPNGSPAVS